MRDEYDDNIGIYTPLIRRIIILVSVIIAVPVVLWTITTFMRNYVGPSRAPVYHPIAAATATPEPTIAAAAMATASQSANAAAAPFATGNVGAPNSTPATLHAASMTSAGSASGGVVAVAATATGTGTPGTSLWPAAATTPDPGSSNAPAQTATPGDQLSHGSAGAAGNGTAVAELTPAAGGPGAVAPDRVATAGSSDGAPTADLPASTGSTPADGVQVATTDQDTDALPPAQPITGPIPLPYPRPHDLALANLGIPMPRPRPAEASDDSVAAAPPGPLNWLSNIFHQGEQQNAPKPPADE